MQSTLLWSRREEMGHVDNNTQLLGVKKAPAQGYTRSAFQLFKGLAALTLAYVVCKSAFEEMGPHGAKIDNSAIGGAVAIGGLAARRHLLSLNGTGQAIYPKGDPYDSGFPITDSFSMADRDSSSFIGLSEQPFTDGGGQPSTRIWSVFGGETASISDGQFAPDPMNSSPQRYPQVVKGVEGNFGAVHTFSVVGGTAAVFTIRDADRAEIVDRQNVFSEATSLDFNPTIEALSNGNFVAGVVSETKLVLSIRNGNADSEGVAGDELFKKETFIGSNTAATRHCSIAARSDNTFVAGFEDQGTSGSDNIRLTSFDISGNAVGTSASFAGREPKATILANGNTAIYYLDGTDTLMQKEFSFSGTAFTEVATRTLSDKIVLDYDVVKRSNGCFTVAISDGLTYLQPLTESGAMSGRLVPANGGFSAIWPRLANMGDDLVLGVKNTTNAIFQVFRSNAPPITSALGSLSLYFNQSQVVDMTSFRTDMDEAEGETISASLTQGPAFAFLQGDDLHLNPGISDVGSTSPVTVEFTDELGQVATSSGSITIQNYFPTFTTPGSVSQDVQEGAEQLLAIPTATDAESSVSYSLEGNPVWAVIDGGNIRLTPPIGASTTSFNVVATDANGGSNTKQVTATVTDDPAPIFTETGMLQIGVDEGDSLTRSFPPATDNGPFTYSITGPAWVTPVTESTVVTGYQMAPPVGVSGTFPITFHAVDEHGQETTRAGEVTVADVPAPVFADTSPMSASVTAGLSKALALPTVTGQKGPFTYSLAGSPPSWATIAGGELALDPPDGIAGDFSFTLLGTDQLGQPTPPLSVQTTIVANMPPVFVETGTIAHEGVAGTTTFYDLPEVNDEGEAVTWSLETTDGSTVPLWAHVTPTGYSIAPPVDGAGSYPLKLVATDPQGLRAERVVEFNVAAPPSGGGGGDDDIFLGLGTSGVMMLSVGLAWRLYKWFRNRNNENYKKQFGLRTACIECSYVVTWPFFAGRWAYRKSRQKLGWDDPSKDIGKLPSVFSASNVLADEGMDPSGDVELQEVGSGRLEELPSSGEHSTESSSPSSGSETASPDSTPSKRSDGSGSSTPDSPLSPISYPSGGGPVSSVPVDVELGE